MAYNNYVDANLVLGKIGSAALVGGVPLIAAVQSWVIGATDYVTSTPIYRVFKDIPSDAIITALEILNDAVAGVTAATVGLRNSLSFDGVGATISDTLFCASISLSGGNAASAGWVNCLTAVSIANKEKQLWELASQTQYPGAAGPKAASYDIVIAMPSMTTNTANIAMKLSYIRGV